MKNQIIHNLPFILIVIPIFLTFTFYQIMYLISKQRWKAIHFSVQASTIFYIAAVVVLLDKWIEQPLTGYILIGLILTLSIILIIQWKIHTEVILRNGLKLLARISFLIFFIAYIILISYEVIQFIYINYSN